MNMSRKFEHFISASTGSLLQLADTAQHPYYSYAGKWISGSAQASTALMTVKWSGVYLTGVHANNPG